MASESEQTTTTETPRSFLQRLNRNLSFLTPFILGFTTTSITGPDSARVESPESTFDPGDESGNRSSPDESTQRERLILFNRLIHSMNDPDSIRVEPAETGTDRGDDSGNRSSPDESTRRERINLFNRLIQSLTDPDTTRVESGETRIDPFNDSENRSSPDESTRRARIILINPITQSMMVMEGVGFDSLFRGAQGKGGQPPASKSSIEAMPRVEIREGEEKGECVICLEEFDVGNIIKQMPCRHGFHEQCIEKWLGIHGSCPVCRYKMPIDEEGGQKSEERESQRVIREIWGSVSFGGSRRRDNGAVGDGSSSDDHMET